MLSNILYRTLVLACLKLLIQANYIANGDFESPAMSPDNQMLSYPTSGSIPNWVGEFDILGTNFYENMTTGQSCDLATLQNGYIEQTISLPSSGTYLVAFRQKCLYPSSENCIA